MYLHFGDIPEFSLVTLANVLAAGASIDNVPTCMIIASFISFISLLLVSLLVSVSAFAPITTSNSGRSSTSIYQYATGTQQFVEVTDLRSPRDVYSMEQWATQYGLQKADGVELYSTNDEMKDYSLYTSNGIAAGQTALFVPSDIVLNSEVIAQEFSDGSLSAAEESLIQIDNQARFPLLYVRLL